MVKSDKIKINIISESAFTVQGHGVHTAYVEHMNSLKKIRDINVITNKDEAADIIHIHTVGTYGLRFLVFGKARKKFVSAHVVPESFIGSLVGAKYWAPLAKIYLRWFYNRADGVFAVSAEVVGQLKAMGVRRPVYLMPNTIDISTFKNSSLKRAAGRKKLKLDRDDFVVVCSGQVQPRKGIDTWIACAQALPEVTFLWIGGIPFKKLAADYEEMKKIMESAPSNVIFTGVIDHKDVYQYYWASGLFFLPSYQETFGIVIVEGAAAGLPVLLRDNEQYRATFKDWYTAADSDQEFIALIKKFRDNKKFYKTKQEKAEDIAERYDSAQGAKSVLRVYEHSLRRHRGHK